MYSLPFTPVCPVVGDTMSGGIVVPDQTHVTTSNPSWAERSQFGKIPEFTKEGKKPCFRYFLLLTYILNYNKRYEKDIIVFFTKRVGTIFVFRVTLRHHHHLLAHSQLGRRMFVVCLPYTKHVKRKVSSSLLYHRNYHTDKTIFDSQNICPFNVI